MVQYDGREKVWRTTFFAVVAAGLAVSAICQAALAWDGSYYLFLLLHHQAPLVIFQRYGMVVFQLPVLVAARLTDDLGLLRMAFAIPYALTSLIALAASWWAVRDRQPGLFIWPALGICVVCLPGQLFEINETLMAAELVWVPALVTLVARSRRDLAGGAAVTLAMLSLTAASTYMVLLIAGIALLSAVTRPRERRMLLVWAAVLAAAATLRVPLFGADYQNHHVSLGALRDQYHLAVRGAPLVAVAAAWSAGLGILVATVRPAHARVLVTGTLVALGVAALALAAWAVTPTAWANGFEYRDLAILLELPLVALAAADGLRSNGRVRQVEHRSARWPVVAAVGLMFALVLGLQSMTWGRLTSDMGRQLAASKTTCTDPKVIGGRETALGHWSKPALAVVLQGRDPNTLLLVPTLCEQARTKGLVQITYFDEQPVAGWFRFRLTP